MKKLNLHEIREIEMEILKEVTKFCDKENIIYYLSGGTLLGAVRHKGFIPWDDDIDIMMPRPDYIRFIKEYSKWNKRKYNVTSIYNDKNVLIPFTKVFDIKTKKIEKNINYNKKYIRGVDIDIFPLDGLPSNGKDARRFLILQGMLLKAYVILLENYTKHTNKTINIIKLFIYIIIKSLEKLKLIDIYKIIKIINKNSVRYNFYNSRFVAISVFPNYGQYRTKAIKSYESYNFKERIKIRFEDNYFYVPIGYDKYLQGMYGNYMKLPPKNKRKTHHMSDSYWIN